MRIVTGGVIAAAAAAAAVALVLASPPNLGHSAPPVTKTVKPPFKAVPYYLSVTPTRAVVYRTATGGKVASIPWPHRATFAGVAAAGDDRTFVVASEHNAALRFYLVRLGSNGRGGRAISTGIAPLRERSGNCVAGLAGLAVSPDGKLLAISVLTDCPTGNAGPGKIMIVRLRSGHLLTTFHPGDGYPQYLSWTAAGGLAYQWNGTTQGIFLIPDATSAHSAAHLIIRQSAQYHGFSGPAAPLIAPSGAVVFAAVSNDNNKETLAEFSAKTGKILRLLGNPVPPPAQFCSPLWSSASGQDALLGCGDAAEAELSNGRYVKLPSHWKLPFYPVPSAPMIAW